MVQELSKHELAALQYAEKYGIIEYSVQGHTMAYTEHYPNEGIYYAEVHLDTGEETRGRVVGSGYGSLDENSYYIGDFYNIELRDGTTKRVKSV